MRRAHHVLETTQLVAFGVAPGGRPGSETHRDPRLRVRVHQRVAPPATHQRVGPKTPVNLVGPASTGEVIEIPRADDTLKAAELVATGIRTGCRARGKVHRDPQLPQSPRVAVVQRVAPRPTDEGVRPLAPGNQIGPGITGDVVVVPRANHVLDAADPVPARYLPRGEVYCDTHRPAEGQRVTAGPAVQNVRNRAGIGKTVPPRQPVVALPALEHVFAPAPFEPVVARTAKQRVVAPAAVQRIVARAPMEHVVALAAR